MVAVIARSSGSYKVSHQTPQLCTLGGIIVDILDVFNSGTAEVHTTSRIDQFIKQAMLSLILKFRGFQLMAKDPELFGFQGVGVFTKTACVCQVTKTVIRAAASSGISISLI